MKNLKIIFLFFAISLLGCEEKIIDGYDTIKVDGLVYYKNDMTLINGKVLYWQNEDKQKLNAEMKFKDGILNGMNKLFYENGELKSEFPYKNGLREGISKIWNENGQLISEITYKKDIIDGVLRRWYDNGQIDTEITFKDGLENGLGKGWYENGQIKLRVTHKDGVLIGGQFWNESGQEINK